VHGVAWNYCTLGRLEINWVEKPQQFLFYSYLLLFITVYFVGTWLGYFVGRIV
jgi:hypothetical protein